MYKKGFTLVELAIVLVIIGLIMGMAIKGKSLITTARVRAEINKLIQIQTAFATIYATNSKLPPRVGNTEYFDMDIFKEKSRLSPSTFSSEYAKTTFSLASCTYYTATFGDYRGFVFSNTANDVCISMPQAATTFLCNVEVMLDDKEETTGLNRHIGKSGSNVIKIPTNNFEKDCDSPKYVEQHDFGFQIF